MRLLLDSDAAIHKRLVAWEHKRRWPSAPSIGVNALPSKRLHAKTFPRLRVEGAQRGPFCFVRGPARAHPNDQCNLAWLVMYCK